MAEEEKGGKLVRKNRGEVENISKRYQKRARKSKICAKTSKICSKIHKNIHEHIQISKKIFLFSTHLGLCLHVHLLCRHESIPRLRHRLRHPANQTQFAHTTTYTSYLFGCGFRVSCDGVCPKFPICALIALFSSGSSIVSILTLPSYVK